MALKISQIKQDSTYELNKVETQSIDEIKNQDSQEQILTEREVFQKLDNPFVNKVIDFFHDNGQVYIISEYAQNGELEKMIKQRKP